MVHNANPIIKCGAQWESYYPPRLSLSRRLEFLDHWEDLHEDEAIETEEQARERERVSSSSAHIAARCDSVASYGFAELMAGCHFSKNNPTIRMSESTAFSVFSRSDCHSKNEKESQQ